MCPVGSTSVQCFKLELIDVWVAYAGITHYWTPELRSNVAGSWSSAHSPLGPLSAFGGGGNWDEANVYLNLIWSPVKNLDIGLEGIYGHYKVDRGVIGAFNQAAIVTSCAGTQTFGASCSADAWGGIFRVQRNF